MNMKSLIAFFCASLFMVSTAAYAQPAREEALEALSRYEAQLDMVEDLNVTYSFEVRYQALPLTVARNRKRNDPFHNRGLSMAAMSPSTIESQYNNHVKKQVELLMTEHHFKFWLEYHFSPGIAELIQRDDENKFTTRQVIQDGKVTQTTSRTLPNGIISTEPEVTFDVVPGRKWMIIGAFTWLDHVFAMKENNPQVVESSNGRVTFAYQKPRYNGIGVDEHQFTFFQKEGYFLPLRHITKSPGVVQEQEFTNYREINGVYVPEKIISKFRDAETGEAPPNFKPYDETITLVEE